MAQEFTINSSAIESKINQLLPSQGGFGSGVDFSASTMVIPIVDLTETAEGSNVREDLQTALSHGSASVFNVNNATTTIVNTTGYFRLFGNIACESGSSAAQEVHVILGDGSTDKVVYGLQIPASAEAGYFSLDYDNVVFLKAGDLLKIKCTSSTFFRGSTRQIADITGSLVNPI
tara:strand:+ start:209 stop:733 length:525 start_codon:yes stop_codon:yes gene_type:complete